MSNFQYTDRWPVVGQHLDPQAITTLEAHDRELEQYLYAPPRAWSPLIFANALNTPVDVTSGFTIAAARWERLRGRFCTASVIARAIDSPVASLGTLGIALPSEASPAPPPPGIAQTPVGGIAMRMRYANPLPPSREFIALRAYDQRATCGHWLVVYAASNTGGGGNPQMQVGDFDPSQSDVLDTTFMWRAT